jgi:hypothetical protein
MHLSSPAAYPPPHPGIALKVNPQYSIVSECMPYLSRRLLSDNNPRMRAALRHLLYGEGKRIDLARLSKMMSAFSNFSTDGELLHGLAAWWLSVCAAKVV